MISIRTRNIQNLGTATLVFCLIAASSARAAEPAPKQAVPPKSPAAPEDVVVEVNGSRLTQAELDATVMQAIQAKGLDKLPPEMMTRLRTDLVPNMIAGFVSKVLLESDAKKQNLQADASEVDKTVAGIKANFPDPAAFAAILKDNNTTEAALRADIETEMKIKQLLEKCTAGLPEISKDQVKAFYEKEKENFQTDETVHARHVLIACADTEPDKTRTEKKALAEKVRKKIVDGSDFGAMAKEHSDCPSKENGGDLGTFERGRMVGAFEDAAFLQKVDEVGPVVTTKFGYHIIQVLEHNKAGLTPIEDVTDKISDYLKNRQEQDAILKYIEGLKKNAKIKYRDPQIDPAAAN